jgi:hypothetical protein
MWENLVRPLNDFGMQMHRAALPNGAVLVVGRDERKREVMELTKKLLAEAGSRVSVESLNAPGYFSLKCGLIKGMIQFETVKDQVEDGPSGLFALSEQGVKSLSAICEGEHVAFLYIGDEYDPRTVEEWLRTKVLAVAAAT